jgi:hypothetical protein
MTTSSPCESPVICGDHITDVHSSNHQLLRTRLDPLINPGKVASHVHNIAGTSSFLSDQSFNQSVAGEVSLSLQKELTISARAVYSKPTSRATGLLSCTSKAEPLFTVIFADLSASGRMGRSQQSREMVLSPTGMYAPLDPADIQEVCRKQRE